MTEKQLRTIDKINLTVNQREALRQLKNWPDGITPAALGKSIGLKQPTASSWGVATLKGLEKRNLAKRLPNNKWVAL